MKNQKVKISTRTAVSTGDTLYQITKPGYKFDFYLSDVQVEELLDELERLGRI